MRKLILFLLVAIGLVYGGIHLYFWYTLTSYTDKFITLARPLAHISYDGTVVSLSGKLGLEDIEIRPMGYDTAITIDALTLQADNLWVLYNISSTLQEGRLPEHMALNVDGLRFDISDPLFQQYVSSPGIWGALGLPYAALGCNGRTAFTGSTLRQMGVREINTSASVGYTFNPETRLISLQINTTTPDLSAMDVSLDFTMPGTTLTPSALRGASQLPLAGGHFNFEDRGWHAKMRKFCAAETQLAEEAYVTTHADTVWRALAADGIQAGDTLKAAYQNFLQDDGSLTLALNISRPLPLQNLQFYAPDDILIYLAPTLQINGEPVSLSEIKASEKFARKDLTQYTRKLAPAENTTPANFSAISVNQLGRHVGEVVRLTTSGRIFEGRLVRMEKRIARLQVKSYSGEREEIVLLRAITDAAVAKPVEKETEK